jgi:protein-S-isoprenylcysteine O-methyltransferase Ste14
MTAAGRAGPATLTFAWGGAVLFVVSLVFFLYSYLFRFDRHAGGPAAAPIAIDLALFTIFAVHHSAFARSGARAWLRRALPPAVERAVYTWAASALFVLVCAAWQPVPGVLYRLEGWAAAAGYGVQLAGILLTIRGSSAIDVLDLAGVRPVLDARLGHEPRHVPLETGGLYGVVRHPLYFAWTLFVFGAPHMTATRFTFAAISTAYLALAIPFEERSLVDVFGDDYRRYRQRVRWRMLPGIY